MGFFTRRLIHGAFLLFGVSLLSFLFLELAPGDFFEEMRLNPQISPETVAALRAQYGFDRPLPVRYARWLGSVLRGEFGFSFAYNSPVAPLLLVRGRNTLFLSAVATLLAWLIAVPLGVWSAARQRSWLDRFSSGAMGVLLATPDLLLGLALVMLVVRSGYLPSGGMVSLGFDQLSWWQQVKDVAAHLTLPVLALVLSSLPVLVRHARATMVEVLQSPFVLAARAHGIPQQRLWFRHALPAAAHPLISLFGFSIATLLSGSLLVEVIMSWPGLGPLLLEAVLARDLYVVIGAVLCSATFLVVGTLLADVLLLLFDPRISREAP